MLSIPTLVCPTLQSLSHGWQYLHRLLPLSFVILPLPLPLPLKFVFPVLRTWTILTRVVTLSFHHLKFVVTSSVWSGWEWILAQGSSWISRPTPPLSRNKIPWLGIKTCQFSRVHVSTSIQEYIPAPRTCVCVFSAFRSPFCGWMPAPAILGRLVCGRVERTILFLWCREYLPWAEHLAIFSAFHS